MEVKGKLLKRVHDLLAEEKYRDDDFELAAELWLQDLKEDNIKHISALVFIELFKVGHFTNPDSASRVRRSIQEKNVHLRGANYNSARKVAGRGEQSHDSYEDQYVMEFDARGRLINDVIENKS